MLVDVLPVTCRNKLGFLDVVHMMVVPAVIHDVNVVVFGWLVLGVRAVGEFPQVAATWPWFVEPVQVERCTLPLRHQLDPVCAREVHFKIGWGAEQEQTVPFGGTVRRVDASCDTTEHTT